LHYQKLITTLMAGDDNHKINLKEIQEQFNTQLIELLHEMKLDAGIDSVNDYKKLLAHYRNLAALIDPAKAMKTIIKHTVQDTEVIQTEIAIPITKKTPVQKQQIDVMKKIILRQPAIYNDFHSSKKEAFQLVNQAFCVLLKMDDRRLPAQARLSIGPTIKNGYIVINKCDFTPRGGATTSTHFTTLRCASLVYVGEDDNKVKMDRYASENLLQLLAAGGNKNLHMTMLLTNTVLNHQDIMIKTTKSAIEINNKVQSDIQTYFSYIPLNFQGSTEKAVISSVIAEHNLRLPTHFKAFDFMNREARLEYAAHVIYLFFNVVNFINVTTCASGIDRTGTALEAATQLWLLNQCLEHNINVTKADIENQRALGCHNALLASFSAPGSPGMKHESMIAGYFSSLTEQFFYRHTSQTNKLPLLDEISVQALLNIWQDKKNIVYEKVLLQIQNARSEAAISLGVNEWLEMAIPTVKEKKILEVLVTQSFFFAANTTTIDIRTQVTAILLELENGIEEDNINSELLSKISKQTLELLANAHHTSMPENVNIILIQLNNISKKTLKKLAALGLAMATPSPASVNRMQA
jgi:hypothetical protein